MEVNMSLKASDIMTRTVVTVGLENSVKEVATILCAHGISAAPVCSVAGQLAGVISEGDLMQSLGTARLQRKARWLDLLAEGDDLAPAFMEYIKVDRRPAGEIMTSPAITAQEDTPVSDLADLMTKNRIRRLPIMRGQRLIGIVSRSDIIRTLTNTNVKVMDVA
jgi:CBS domain-containing protein